MTAYRALYLLLLVFASFSYAQDPPNLSSLEFFPTAVPGDGVTAAPASPTERSSTMQGRTAVAATEMPANASSDDVEHVISARLESIDEEIAANGGRSRALIDALSSVAALYEELGDSVSALATLRQALAVTRMSSGLYTLDQAHLLERMLVHWETLGDDEEVASLEEELLELVARHPDDPRIAFILEGAADRAIDEVHRFLRDGPEPVISISTGPEYGTGSDGQRPQSSREAALASLRNARRHYVHAALAGIETGGYDVAHLLEVEEKVLESLVLEVMHPELQSKSGPVRNHPTFSAGETAFEDHVDNMTKLRQPPEAVAAALLKLGDWRLLGAKNARAIETYRAAHYLLRDHGAPAETIARLLSPEVPVALPAAEAAPVDDESTESYRGYIDVSFVIGRYGTTSRTRVLETSENAPKTIEKRLRRMIADNRFRPRVVNGRFAQSERVSVRYHYDY